jgi:hypothetical protein
MPRVCAGTNDSTCDGTTVAKARGVAVADEVGLAVGLMVGETRAMGDSLRRGDGMAVAEGLGADCSGTQPMTSVATMTAMTRMPSSVSARIATVDERAAKLVSTWLDGLSPEGRRTLYTLLDEVCSGLDVSRHNPFGFLRLRAEFETSGELFGCTLPQLRDAVAASLGSHLPPERPRSALESLRDEISSRGHPDFR